MESALYSSYSHVSYHKTHSLTPRSFVLPNSRTKSAREHFSWSNLSASQDRVYLGGPWPPGGSTRLNLVPLDVLRTSKGLGTRLESSHLGYLAGAAAAEVPAPGRPCEQRGWLWPRPSGVGRGPSHCCSPRCTGTPGRSHYTRRRNNGWRRTGPCWRTGTLSCWSAAGWAWARRDTPLFCPRGSCRQRTSSRSVRSKFTDMPNVAMMKYSLHEEACLHSRPKLEQVSNLLRVFSLRNHLFAQAFTYANSSIYQSTTHAKPSLHQSTTHAN